MLKTYLRYTLQQTFGLIASAESNAIFTSGMHNCASTGLDSVILWNIKHGLIDRKLAPSRTNGAFITVLAETNSGEIIAAGYSDGSIRIWRGESLICTLQGHRSGVSALDFYDHGKLLVSGGRDTDIIIWDVVGEMGICRLRSHKDQITKVKFVNSGKHIVSSSKDGLLKVWDVKGQCCIQTLVGHQGEVWAFDCNQDESRMVSGGSDDTLRVWKRVEQDSSESGFSLEFIGEIELKEKTKSGKKVRICEIRYSPSQHMIYAASTDKYIERIKVRGSSEIKKKLKRKLKRMKEKMETSEETPAISQDLNSEEFLEFDSNIPPIRSSQKIRSFDIISGSSSMEGDDRILLVENDNVLRIVSASIPDSSDSNSKWEYEYLHSIEMPGHRAGIRGMSLSTDDSLLLTTSNGSTKLWNVHSNQILRTFDSSQEYGISVLFLPGNQYFVVGTKSGNIELHHIPSGELLETISAHSNGPVWSLDLDPAGNGIVSAGSDHEVKFWEFEMLHDNTTEQEKLTLTHTKTLQIQDEVLCVKWSKDGKYVAVASLDSQIRIFFADTLKLHLVLYGHKLPVMSIDISDDSRYLVSGSADKTIKLWGMDFGDCNKSFAAAHEDSVMCVKFVPKTHYFFSCSKDKSIKYWDADRKIKIQNVEPIDQSELWTLCVFGTGNGIVAAGNSKAIRVFHETSDVVYVDEENEKELEKVFEEEAVRDADALLDAENKPGAIEGSYLSGPSEVGQAGKGTLENLKASERLVDYLDIIKQELSTNPQPNQISQNPLLMGKSVEEFIAYAISTIPTPDLQVSIILLPFDHALRLLEYTNILVERNMLIELCVRCQLYIIETHIQQLSSNDSYVDLLLKIRTNSRKRLSAHKDLLGLNLAAMKYIQQEISKPNKKIRLAPA